MISALKQFLPRRLRNWLCLRRLNVERQLLPFDRVTDFSVLRRIRPYRPLFGWRRGRCVDRFYIEQFLSQHSQDIRGRAVEIGKNLYMAQFGGNRITRADVLDFVDGPGITLCADLASAPAIPDNSFDSIICTQTLMYVYDLRAAVKTLHRTLAPGGVALITLAGITQLAPPSMTGGADDFWRFTRASAHKLFADVFGPENIEVQSFGNVLTAMAFLHGLVADELTPEEFANNDPDYPLIVTVRAVKAPSTETAPHA